MNFVEQVLVAIHPIQMTYSVIEIRIIMKTVGSHACKSGDNAEKCESSRNGLSKLKIPSRALNEGVPAQIIFNDNFFIHFRGMLILGRILGVIPLSGVFQSYSKGLQFRLFSFPRLHSLTCVILLTFNAIAYMLSALTVSKKNNPSEIAHSMRGPMFASWGLFVYGYFWTRGKHLIKFIKSWDNCKPVYTLRDRNLSSTSIIISVFLFTSCVLENAVLHMEFFEAFDNINGHNSKYGKEQGNVSVTQMYYWRAHEAWNKLLGYHPVTAVLAGIVHKWVLYSWNYIDVLAALVCRALYFKFKALCDVAGARLQPSELLNFKHDNSERVTSEMERQAWTQLATDHKMLCKLLSDVNEFFSPLLFMSYAVNIYFVCIQLLGSLNPAVVSHSIVHSIYAPWSFIHIIVRIFVLTLFAAKVNVYAHKVGDLIQRCPADAYNEEVAKLDKRVNANSKLGLTGLGCFVITMPFMLSILNVVFTIEIVLLQGLSSTSGAVPNCTA